MYVEIEFASGRLTVRVSPDAADLRHILFGLVRVETQLTFHPQLLGEGRGEGEVELM